MSKPYTILHISDLHRSPDDLITNDELISALVTDFDKYQIENPSIRAPDAIIVSGDIIQGVLIGQTDFKQCLKDQYQTALSFLDELTKRFLNGDRSKVIIIPGNHDVDWNTALNSMQLLPDSDIPSNFASLLSVEDSMFRWDWKKRNAYTITDRALYEKRLECFWDFFAEFYKDVTGLFKVKPRNDANLYFLNERKIGIAAFNSCNGNDCFAYHGHIKKDVVARTYLDFRDADFFGLLIAVWHHNLDGPPYRTDYMDVDIVRGMIGRGFRLGLYGHQHKAQVAPFQIWLPENETMALVSAGSLCAGKRELPQGYNRQYNILEISEDLLKVRVHVREMLVANLFSSGRFKDLGGVSYVDLNWELPKNLNGEKVDRLKRDLQKEIIEAEEAFKTNAYETTLEILNRIDLPENTYQRKLFIDAAELANDWQKLIDRIIPGNMQELESLINAFERVKDFDGGLKAIENFEQRFNAPKNVISEFRRRLEIKKKINQNV